MCAAMLRVSWAAVLLSLAASVCADELHLPRGFIAEAPHIEEMLACPIRGYYEGWERKPPGRRYIVQLAVDDAPAVIEKLKSELAKRFGVKLERKPNGFWVADAGDLRFDVGPDLPRTSTISLIVVIRDPLWREKMQAAVKRELRELSDLGPELLELKRSVADDGTSVQATFALPRGGFDSLAPRLTRLRFKKTDGKTWTRERPDGKVSVIHDEDRFSVFITARATSHHTNGRGSVRLTGEMPAARP
jgi:hypothetical protein